LLRDDASPNATGGSGTPLETAASVGDARMTAFLLAHGAQATLGIPLFHVGNHVDVARLLIAHGADINLTITFGHYADTPLCNAALDNHLEVARLLLDAGARVNAGDPPPLYRAVNYSNVRMIKLLLARGADPNRGWTYTGCPPLHVAETEDIATLLLKAGANINVCDNGGKTTLGHAWPNDTAWIAWLRARGAKYAGELAQ
jgi:ankyrin repeat protein